MAETKKKDVKELTDEEKLGLLKKTVLAKLAKKNMTEAQLQDSLNKLKRIQNKIGKIDQYVMIVVMNELDEEKKIKVVDLITIYRPNVPTLEVECYMPIYGLAANGNIDLKQKVKAALKGASQEYGMNVPELQEAAGEPNHMKVLRAVAELDCVFAPTQRTHGFDPETGCPYPFDYSYVLPPEPHSQEALSADHS